MARAIKRPEKKAAPALVATSVRLPPETKSALEKAATADDRTFTSLVTKILHDWLKDNGFLK
jgi:predicted transcriptional regulator